MEQTDSMPYYCPDDGGYATPQIGYFLPLSTVYCLSPPRTRKRDMSPARSRRSMSYCGSGPPTPTPFATLTNGAVNGNGNGINGLGAGCSRRSSLALNNNHHHGNGCATLDGHHRSRNGAPQPPLEPVEVYAEPVDDGPLTGERSGNWELHRVSVTRVSGYGFGIAVSGGRDNPHFANGDPSIAVSDVLRCGPAEDLLQVNDRIVSANGVPLDNVEYATAVQVLRESGDTVSLVVKRRLPSTSTSAANNTHQNSIATPTAAARRASMSPAGMGQTTGAAGHHARSQSYGSPTASPPPLLHNSSQPLQQHGIKIALTKAGKKEDFGIVLGCRLFIKELSAKAREQLALSGQILQEGDIVTRLHNTSCADSMGLKEARKIMEGCKERLSIVVTRNATNGASMGNGTAGSGLLSTTTPSTPQNNLSAASARNTSCSHAAQNSHCSMDDTLLSSGPTYSAQNLYVVPPTRPTTMPASLDDKSNLLPRGRSRNPLLDVSLSQLDRPSTPQGTGHSRSRSAAEEPPRPPPPRAEDYYSSRKQLFEEDPLVARNKQPASEARYITFQKEGSVGIRLTGGNEAGVFVAAVQPGSPASLQGLAPGDRLLRVNEVDMRGVTREEAVLLLLGLQERVDLIVKHCREDYDRVVASQKGDNFHVKTHFHYAAPLKGESSFRSGDVFRVLDTLHNGVVGSWQVLRVGRNNHEMQKAVIPNKARAEELATAQFNATKKELSASESRGNFFRRRRSSHRRSKSLSREHWDDVVFSDSVSKFPAYERVVLRHPGFMRPVVLFGAVADLARDRLLKDFPDKFTAPQLDNNLEEISRGPKAGGIIRLSGIRDIMDRGRHALLDITPNAVDRLNYAQFYPIVIFLKADSKHTIKQHRQGVAKTAHKSSKKLLEQSQKLERVWGHVFSGQVTLGEPDAWYRKLRDLIDQLQGAPVWASESKPEESLSDDFLFPMTSRLSYASSPESDLELSPGAAPRLVKASSDPSVATAQDNGDRDDLNLADALPPPYSSPYDHSSHVRRSADSKYGFSNSGGGEPTPAYPRGPNNAPTSQQNLYGPDRAVKPPSLSRSATSAQDRLFGSKDQNIPTADEINGYHQRGTVNNATQHQQSTRDQQGNQLQGSLDRSQQSAGSLDRTRAIGAGIREPPPGGTGSYDSVSSYDSYSNTLVRDPLGASTTRLGPNAPDDLKSVPPGSKQFEQMSPRNSTAPDGRSRDDLNSHQHAASPHRQPYHQHEGSVNNTGGQHQHQHPQQNGGMRAGQLSPRPVPPNYQDPRGGPYQDGRGGQYQDPRGHDPYRFTRSTAQPVANDGRRPPQTLETKTDYGKYSQTADYKQSPVKTGPPPPLSPGGMGGVSGGGYKPVPPPKPKNYRPPVPGWGEEPAPPPNKGYAQNGHAHGHSHGHNGLDAVPRSPNGYSGNGGYYSGGSSQQSGGGGWPPPQQHGGGGGHAPPHGQQAPHYGYPPPPPNTQHYAQRSPHGMPNMNQHVQDARGHHGPPLDLAGSREQRGSAFELYRKPQAISHHHNMSESDQKPESAGTRCKKSILKKSPLANIKDLFRGPKTLRRQNSLCEKSSAPKIRPILRRQNSMLEPKTRFESPLQTRRRGSEEIGSNEPVYVSRREIKHEPFYQRFDDAGDEPIFQSRSEIGRRNEVRFLTQDGAGCGMRPMQENPYANRLEIRQQMVSRNESPYATRREMEDRIEAERQRRQMYQSRKEAMYQTNQEAKYQSKQEAMYQSKREAQEAMYQSKREAQEGVYQSKQEALYQSKRDAMYQSRKEMQDQIYSSKREVQEALYQSKKEALYQTKQDAQKALYQSRREALYQSKMEALQQQQQQEPPYQSRKEIRDQIYQTKREAIYGARNSPYQSRKEIEDTIYEAKEETSTAEVDDNEKNLRNDTNFKSNHISSVIKRTAPPVTNSPGASRTSLETQYTSQMSLKQPPNAHSTPYASDISLLQQMKSPVTCKGNFNSAGGTLKEDTWGVSLIIPPGALPDGPPREIYFTVTDPRHRNAVGAPPLDCENGETMLSPLVMCGPQGLEFLVPVTLNIPHYASATASLGLALKATDSERDLQTGWDNIRLPSNIAANVVSVKVDHF